ncbi:MAG: MBL fold metallo-hydrolase [Bacteroidota bacterium]|nr:MBL fold metallo-hydrolase [Bacteroidota bacterium]
MNILRLKLGNANIYFIRSAVGWMLIDTGIPGKSKKILRFMRKHNIQPCKIQLIVITHAHYDHAGNLEYLKFLTNARIFIHRSEADIIEQAKVVLPAPVTPLAKLGIRMFSLFKRPMKFNPVKADETIQYKTDLRPYGFSASIVPTPGHTEGSVSVMFENGNTFTGDTCFNLKFTRHIIPPFINDKKALLQSWHTLNENGVKHFYPGHGKPFDFNKFIKSFKRLEKMSQQ